MSKRWTDLIWWRALLRDLVSNIWSNWTVPLQRVWRRWHENTLELSYHPFKYRKWKERERVWIKFKERFRFLVRNAMRMSNLRLAIASLYWRRSIRFEFDASVECVFLGVLSLSHSRRYSVSCRRLALGVFYKFRLFIIEFFPSLHFC